MKAKVAVDKVGRLVLPKGVRDAIGVAGPMILTVEVVGNAARLTAPEQPQGLVSKKGGRPVFSGALPEDWDSGEAVIQSRARRLRR